MPKLNKGVRLGWLAVQRGMDTKAAAMTYGCSRQMLERKAREAGMRRKLVTPDEFDQVLTGRLTAPNLIVDALLDRATNRCVDEMVKHNLCKTRC